MQLSDFSHSILAFFMDQENDIRIEGFSYTRYISPDMPDKILKILQQKYDPKLKSEDAIVFYDSTLFNNARNGVLFSDEGVYIKCILTNLKYYPYNQIYEVYSPEKDHLSIRVIGEVDEPEKMYLGEFSIPKLISAIKKLAEMYCSNNQPATSLQHECSSDNPSPSEEKNDTNEDIITKQQINHINGIIEQFDIRKENSPYTRYLSSDIPEEIYKTLQQKFDCSIKPEDIILFYDSTVFGKARNGILFTWEGVYLKCILSKYRYYPYSQIKELISHQKDHLSVRLIDEIDEPEDLIITEYDVPKMIDLIKNIAEVQCSNDRIAISIKNESEDNKERPSAKGKIFPQQQKMDQALEELTMDIEALPEGNYPPANIIVAGITGTGKSTLINAVFGNDIAETGCGKPVTEHMTEYSQLDIPVRIWDTVGLELDNQKSKNSIKDIKNVITQKAQQGNKYDRIHAIWYCINSGSNRYQSAEINFIKNLYSFGVPFIIVMTQCSGDMELINCFEREIRKNNAENKMDDIEIVQVLSKPVKYRGMIEAIPAFGLDELVQTTISQMPQFIRSSFIAAQRISVEEKRAEAEKIIFACAKKASESRIDQISVLNIVSINNKIKTMLKDIVKLYNNIFDEKIVDKILADCNLNWDNIWNGLLTPFNKKYEQKIAELFAQKKDEGYEVASSDFTEKSKRSARMIAYYGYVFIDSIEKIWEKFNDGELKNIDQTMSKMIDYINEGLKNNFCKEINNE